MLTPQEATDLAGLVALAELQEELKACPAWQRFLDTEIAPAVAKLQEAINTAPNWETTLLLRGRLTGIKSVRDSIEVSNEGRIAELRAKQKETPDNRPATGELA